MNSDGNSAETIPAHPAAPCQLLIPWIAEGLWAAQCIQVIPKLGRAPGPPSDEVHAQGADLEAPNLQFS